MKYLHTSDKKLSYKNFIKLIEEELEENKKNYYAVDSVDTIIEIDDLFLINPKIVEAIRNKTLVSYPGHSSRTSVFDLVKFIYRKFNDLRYINESTLYIRLVRRYAPEYRFSLFLLNENERNLVFITDSIGHINIQGEIIQPLFYKVINGGLNRIRDEQVTFCQRKNYKSIFEEDMVLDNLLKEKKQKSIIKYETSTEDTWETYVGQLPCEEYFKVGDVIRLNPEWRYWADNRTVLDYMWRRNYTNYALNIIIKHFFVNDIPIDKYIKLTEKKIKCFNYILDRMNSENNYTAAKLIEVYGISKCIYPLLQKRTNSVKTRKKIIEVKNVIEFSDNNEIDLLLDNINY